MNEKLLIVGIVIGSLLFTIGIYYFAINQEKITYENIPPKYLKGVIQYTSPIGPTTEYPYRLNSSLKD